MKLLFWSNFSLGVWSCWSIFDQEKRFYARRIEWARASDTLRVKGEAPTMYGAEAPIPVQEVAALIASAKRVVHESDLVESTQIRLDGVSRRLLLPERSGTGIGTYWFAGSAATERLDAWMEEASVSVDNFLTQSSARGGTSAA